ncbi:SWIM zinc finger family protein [Kitasatospora sp. YST-16]|uniref:SWIM zinc finger family protein n=1 Tax=Kitasatospora sp. YST-16 TaxID=2998080 RepID=UPI00228409AF|nr:SWIM zinc finger family protein [Kitasatospora sp. YST-16]WAL72180.1 SWIM zinc finger family protein [Kitasatospora sp. YST-16]WNW38222.1 SWIM zinc finger family protein [Streptomyces sp. Li-HN-5-13]
MEERWSTEHVLSLAPDPASLKAAGKLSGPAPWSATGTGGGALWGLCKGSGSTPYRTAVELGTPAYKCSCPSRKFPCKHALGLLLLWAAGPGAVADGATPPDWVQEWLDGRGRAAADKAAKQQARAADADPEAARKRAGKRSARVAGGARELRLRLVDGVRRGLADPQPAGAWEEVAARMVDAQAPGLASRVRALAGAPQDELLEEYAMLHLLAGAYGRIDTLPQALAATVRTRVGFTTDTAELLAGPTVRDRWHVLGSRDTADDRLTTRRVWLRGAKTGRQALLLAFGRPGQAPDLALPTGRLLEADLAYHPGARPLRAVLGTRYGSPEPAPAAAPAGLSPAAALAEYGAAVAEDPWLDSWPAVLADVVPVRTPDGWQLTDGTHTLPVRRGALPEPALWRLAAVSAGHPVTLFGECGHHGFAPVTAWDADHRPVALG